MDDHQDTTPNDEAEQGDNTFPQNRTQTLVIRYKNESDKRYKIHETDEIVFDSPAKLLEAINALNTTERFAIIIDLADEYHIIPVADIKDAYTQWNYVVEYAEEETEAGQVVQPVPEMDTPTCANDEDTSNA